MKQYEVKTKFIFNGTFFVKADDKAQAMEYVEKHCGLVIGGNIHSTLPSDVVDWDFLVHPDTVIGRINMAKGGDRNEQSSKMEIV